jgi:beta-glucanase (GH16 family)
MIRPRPRPRTVVQIALVVAIACAVAGAMVIADHSDQAGPELTADGMTLVGEDEFDGPAGSRPSPTYWDYDVGGGGWGNREQQVYTRKPANVRLDGHGHLVIQAHKSGRGYTSARMVTRGKVDFTHGLIEARIKFPQGQGIHPAVWLLGSNIKTVGYPASGEIDIMELVDSGTMYHNAIHGPMADNADTKWKQSADGAAGGDLALDYHVYQVRREPGLIKIGIDGKVVGQYGRETAPTGADWVFDAPMYLILNIAVGGDWPGPVNATTPFPATMLVDWIRLWQ